MAGETGPSLSADVAGRAAVGDAGRAAVDDAGNSGAVEEADFWREAILLGASSGRAESDRRGELVEADEGNGKRWRD